MRIGVIGTGNMGRSAGVLWAERGHEVCFGSRDAAKGEDVARLAGHGATHGTHEEAARFGEVLFYSTREMPSKVFGSVEALAGRVLIDCNNREIPDGFSFEPPTRPSIAERIAADAPGARVVKAFNTFGQEVWELSPMPLREHGVSAYVCGDDDAAKRTVSGLAEELGFVAVDCGPLRNAWLLEALADFIRLQIGGMQRGPYATISLHELPAAKGQRLGGRKEGYR